MLLIEQFDQHKVVLGNFVKCPVCKTGRLFDRAAGVRVVTLTSIQERTKPSDPQLYIKCPKCASRVGISFTN